MNQKWLRLQFPYFHPEGSSGNSGAGGSDSRGTEADADLLAEGEDDDTDDNVDDDSTEDDDSKDNSKDNSGDERKRDKKTKPNTEREESDSKDDVSEEKEDSKFGEEFDEDEEEEELDQTEEDETEEDENKEVENEYTVRALKKSYPDIFKKYPEVKDAIFRERMFTKMFGSVDEAEEASTKAQYLDEMSQDLYDGKSENLLKALKKNNEESLKIFANNFLPELFKVDKDLYHEVSDYTLNHMLHVVNNNALKNGNKNLSTAVKYISQFIFGEVELPELKERNKPREKTEAEIALDKREASHERQKYSEFEDAIHAKTRVNLTKVVQEGLTDERMTDFVKDAITDKIIERVGITIAKDQFFQRQLVSLWKKAQRDGYTSEAKSRIISAYLARAKKIVPSVRAEVRKSAASKHTNSNGHNNENTNGKRQGTSGGSGKRPSTLPTDAKKIPASMTDEEILASD